MADSIELDQLLCFDLHAAARAVGALYRPLLAPLGLTYPQYLVLVALWRRPSLSIKELSDQLQLDYGTLTPLLQRMAGAGWLTRRRSETDERSVIVAITPAGKTLRRKLAHVPDQICAGLGLSAVQRQRLQRTLRALTGSALAYPQGSQRRSASNPR